MVTLEKSIIDYLSMLDRNSTERSQASQVVHLASENACSEGHIIIDRISTIIRYLPTPSCFLDVKFGTLAELLRKLDETNEDCTYSIDQHGSLDVDLDGDTADLFSIAVGYATQVDFWIEPRVTGKPRTYQSIIEPIVTACSIRLRSVLTSAVTDLRGVRFRYRSNMERCRERSIDIDVRKIISNVRSVIASVKSAVPNLDRYDVEISGIDIAYWNALDFCKMLERIPEYFYALPLILSDTLVSSDIILMRLETWIKTRDTARGSLATKIQRAYRKHLLKRKQCEGDIFLF